MSELRSEIMKALIGFPPETVTEAEQIVDRVIALIQKEQGWRDVISEMPEPGQHVLMLAPGKTLAVGYLSEVMGYGWRTCPGDHKWKPTHWQPLPTPPQGEWINNPRKSTGMTDEEGREIFEGDWIQFNVTFFDGNFKDEPISGKIVYVPELMSFQLVNVQSDYWREYTGGDDSTYAPFSELNFSEADLSIIEPPTPPQGEDET